MPTLTENLTQAEAWQNAYEHFTHSSGNYSTVFHHNNNQIELSINSSAGGSAEGGYDETVMVADLPLNFDFRFEIHPEDFLQSLGKMFGMQDVVIGFKEFDDNTIVKTNDEARVRALFQDASIREIFQDQSGYSFGIVVEEHRPKLRYIVQHAILDFTQLQLIFDAFDDVLNMLLAK